ncbi:rho GTPase-activating protein 18-like [Haliotis rufescens]|uniref:rho GTPase-activating protein 18-like n=1 Tax=Haliotis rufescens TaxID=6454 RepID=UPI001EAF95DA|nr:rho GTPase-activating protein 18-like [Haliotis rufescens]XP_046362910.1 rho GTPase-activating protein 18-like [Haliotis rufescens]
MASNHGNSEPLEDYWKEFNDIESNKGSDEEEELSKTPDEGEQEAEWLHRAGYGFVASKLHDGKELSDDDLEGLTEELSAPQAEAVRKRIDTLTTTMRKKHKQNKIHVKDIFTNMDPRPPASPTLERMPIRRESAKNRERASFLRSGHYSMSGAPTAEVQTYTNPETIRGVQVLSINPMTTQNRLSRTQLQPITDTDFSMDFHLEERDNKSNSQRSPLDLPAFNLKHNPLGTTRINDLGTVDLDSLRALAHIELTALFDLNNLTFARPKKKKKIKEHGLFGVPIHILLENDQRRAPNVKIPLIFQELIRFLEKEGLRTEGILRVPGAVSRVKHLRHELEEKFYLGNFHWKDVWPNDAAALMKQFIRDLPIPLLTYDYIDAFPQVKSIKTTLEQLRCLNLLVLLLPDEHRETLRVLLRFLRKIVSSSKDNKMSLSNVAMIMAPNLFLGPATRNKSLSIEQKELSKAHGTSSIVKMLIHYQEELWTVPPSFVRQLRIQNEADILRKNRKRGFRARKDKSEAYRRSAPVSEADLAEGVILVKAPHLTKLSTRMKLDELTTARDIVAKFRRIAGPHPSGGLGESFSSREHHSHALHSMSFRNPDNAQFADDNAYLFEVGGNIGERCLDPHTRMMSLLRINPHAEWVIKVHHR